MPPACDDAVPKSRLEGATPLQTKWYRVLGTSAVPSGACGSGPVYKYDLQDADVRGEARALEVERHDFDMRRLVGVDDLTTPRDVALGTYRYIRTTQEPRNIFGGSAIATGSSVRAIAKHT